MIQTVNQSLMTKFKDKFIFPQSSYTSGIVYFNLYYINPYTCSLKYCTFLSKWILYIEIQNLGHTGVTTVPTFSFLNHPYFMYGVIIFVREILLILLPFSWFPVSEILGWVCGTKSL